MKRFLSFLWLALVSISSSVAYPCTSAIIAAHKTTDGRPLLWKHRDTGEENNKVERTPATDGSFEYVAVYNASDSLCREAWMGYNSQGFAIMNTASYNLNNDTIKDMDKEGLVMAEALRKCRTVDDFAIMLDTLPKPLGVEANFGVIDANGDGAYFECGNFSYLRFNLKDAPDGVLMRTNYSHSGRPDDGYGYIREQNEHCLMAPHIENGDFTPQFLTETMSRTFFNSYLGKDYTNSGDSVIVDMDFIPRRSSTATIVIEGVAKDEDPLLTMMWIGLGYPPCSSIRSVFLGEGGVPLELCGITPKGHSPLCDNVVAMKHKVFPVSRGNGKYYLQLHLLYNQEGTGFAQQAIRDNVSQYRIGYIKRQNRAKSLNKKK